MRLFEGLVDEGYTGAYDSVRRFVKQWKASYKNTPSLKQAIKAAHFRLAYSRKMFVVAYLREAQEMVMDAHDKAFAFYGGVTLQMIYDNPKTIVDTIFVGKG